MVRLSQVLRKNARDSSGSKQRTFRTQPSPKQACRRAFDLVLSGLQKPERMGSQAGGFHHNDAAVPPQIINRLLLTRRPQGDRPSQWVVQALSPVYRPPCAAFALEFFSRSKMAWAISTSGSKLSSGRTAQLRSRIASSNDTGSPCAKVSRTRLASFILAESITATRKWAQLLMRLLAKYARRYLLKSSTARQYFSKERRSEVESYSVLAAIRLA